MITFKQFLLSESPDVKALIDSYLAAGEIVNPEYVKLNSSVKKSFERESEVVKKLFLDYMHTMRPLGKEHPAVVDLYYDWPTDGFTSLNKASKKLKALEALKLPGTDQIITAGTKVLNDWIPIAEKLKELKTKVVKTATKRAAVQAAAAVVMQKKFTDSSSLIKVFESHLEEYKKGAANRAEEFIDKRLSRLKDAGWDLSVVAPNPTASVGREQYKMMSALRQFYLSVTEPTGQRMSFKGPEIVKASTTRINAYIKHAVDAAEADYRAFMQKMIEKIGKPVVSAKMTGNIWTNAVLTVETNDGEEQVWNTKMIINYSKYSTAFNQFPSRRQK